MTVLMLAVSQYFLKACFNVHPHCWKYQRKTSWLISIALAHSLQHWRWIHHLSRLDISYITWWMIGWVTRVKLKLHRVASSTTHFLAIRPHEMPEIMWHMIVWLHEGPKVYRNILDFHILPRKAMGRNTVPVMACIWYMPYNYGYVSFIPHWFAVVDR